MGVHQGSDPSTPMTLDVDQPGPSSVLFVDVWEAARRLGVSRSLVYELVADGRLRSVKIGRLRRVPVEALVEFARSLDAS
jgi:excisionase family DNA binding protein